VPFTSRWRAVPGLGDHAAAARLGALRDSPVRPLLVRGHGARVGVTTEFTWPLDYRPRLRGTPVHDETVTAGFLRNYHVVPIRCRSVTTG
jgi:hypothetical protein